MFSGIVEEVGTVRATREMDGARELEIDASVVLEDLQPGASVSLDGACHTVVEVLAGGFTVNSVERRSLGPWRAITPTGARSISNVPLRWEPAWTDIWFKATSTVWAI